MRIAAACLFLRRFDSDPSQLRLVALTLAAPKATNHAHALAPKMQSEPHAHDVLARRGSDGQCDAPHALAKLPAVRPEVCSSRHKGQ